MLVRAGGAAHYGTVHEVVFANVDSNLDRFARADLARRGLALVARDPEAAGAALGRHDVAKASALIGRPPPR